MVSALTNPYIQLFSKILSIDAEVICVGNMVYYYNWEAYILNANDNSIKNQIDLSKNPTATSNNFVIDAFTLEYGLYEFVFQLKGTWGGIEKVYSQNTYHKIIPSGLVIFGLKNGVSCSEIGSKQILSFNPIKYSFDYDNVASMLNLKFDFYCRKVYKNQTHSKIDFQYLNNYTFSNISTDCFNTYSNN